MKNIQFTSQETVLKILGPSLLVAASAVTGSFIGFLMPAGNPRIHGMPLVLAAISPGLALFTWSLFRLIKPARYDRQWQIAEMVLVPLYSLMLTLAAAVYVSWFIQRSAQELQDVFVGTLHGTGLY